MIESQITFNGLVLNDQSVRNPERVMLASVAVTNDSDEITINSASLDEYGAFPANLGLLLDHALFIPEHEPFIVIAVVDANTVQVDRPVPELTGTYPAEVWRSEPYLRVSEIAGLDDGEVRYEAQEISGADGENPSETFYGGRSISLTFQIRAWNLVQLRFWEDKVKQAFGDLQDHEFQYTPRGQQTRTLMARKAQKLDINDVQDGPLFWRNVVVGLRAPSTLALGPTVNMHSIDEFGMPQQYHRYTIPTAQGLKRTYPRTYGQGASASDPRLITHRGNYKAWPTTRIYGPMRNPRVTNNSLLKTIIFKDLVINEGSFVEIEHKTGLIKWYGYEESYSGLDIVNSEFWWLKPGENVVTVIADEFSPESGSRIEISWQDTYL